MNDYPEASAKRLDGGISMQEKERLLSRRGFMKTATCLATAHWSLGASAGLDFRQANSSSRAHLAQNVALLPAPAAGFQARTGDYKLDFRAGDEFISIERSDSGRHSQRVALRPGGYAGIRGMALDASSSIRADENAKQVSIEIAGSTEWGRYRLILLLPRSVPGLINSRLEIEPIRDLHGSEDLFTHQLSELSYTGSTSAEQLIYYLNGTPGTNTYHTAAAIHSAILDNNQWVYFGDPVILRSTVFCFEDFTALNPYFEATRTRALKTMRQPPGCLDSTRISVHKPIEFGYVIPTPKVPVKKGLVILVANTYIYLQPDPPPISVPVEYCGRFIEGIAAVYPYLSKPQEKIIDWVQVTEKGLTDLEECEKALRAENAVKSTSMTKPIPKSTLDSPIVLQTNLNSLQRYANVFKSKRAKRIIGDSDQWWRTMPIQKLPFADAWQYLFPLIMAGDFAMEFNSEAARTASLRVAEEVVSVGRQLNYIFPLTTNADFSKPADIRYEYDCTGAYVYLMMLYYQFTKDNEYVAEARNAADRMLKMGFEFPYEFTTTSVAPLGLLRLYKLTGDRRYLDGINIPIAAILRHSWFFNPAYGDYRGRVIFLLTEGMPGVYANGWEEASLFHFLALLLREGQELLSPVITQMLAELLRWKGTSLSDSLAPYLPNPSIVFPGIPRDWYIPIHKNWNIPLEGFGYLDWDDSGMYAQPGTVGQAFYNFGALPEAALLFHHSLSKGAKLYVQAPIKLTRDQNGNSFTCRLLAGLANAKAFVQTTYGHAICIAHEAGETKSDMEIHDGMKKVWFDVSPGVNYRIDL